MSVTRYTQRTLTSKEKIIYSGDIHRFCYIFPLMMMALGFILLFPNLLPDLSGEPGGEMNMIQYYWLKMIYAFKVKYYEFVMSLPEKVQIIFSYVAFVRRHIIGFILIFISAGLLVNAYIKRISEEHVVTTRKVILKQGWVAVDEKEIALERIEGVKVHQTMFDRLLNRGDILITGIGMEVIEMHHISEPIKFRQAVLNAVDRFSEYHQRRGTPT
ncbi:MAG: PH domain-containing protein [Hyphomicrobiales bacterium]|nr:PH domain-containing protein [Hyphomicrobiales bacterium]